MAFVYYSFIPLLLQLVKRLPSFVRFIISKRATMITEFYIICLDPPLPSISLIRLHFHQILVAAPVTVLSCRSCQWMFEIVFYMSPENRNYKASCIFFSLYLPWSFVFGRVYSSWYLFFTVICLRKNERKREQKWSSRNL